MTSLALGSASKVFIPVSTERAELAEAETGVSAGGWATAGSPASRAPSMADETSFSIGSSFAASRGVSSRLDARASRNLRATAPAEISALPILGFHEFVRKRAATPRAYRFCRKTDCHKND